MAGTVPVLTYLPIDTYGTTDTVNVPKLDIMRGDITPAIFVDKGSGFEIVNKPTPFYMLCTAKIFNGYPQINTIVPNSVLNEAYQQFGVTQGNAQKIIENNGRKITIYGGTNSDGSNSQNKRSFYLNTFQESFLQNATADSPGLLVPMYYSLDPTKGFFFFRADVFYNSSLTTSTEDQLPERPIAYDAPNFPDPNNFPTPGNNVKLSQVYHLASVYTNSTYDQNRIGTWSQFLTDSDIDFYFSSFRNFESGPLATKVYISFYVPQDNSIPIPASNISSSEIYTINRMYQDSTATLKTGGSPFNDFLLNTYTDKTAPGEPNLGYPLNFLYSLGGNSYKKIQGLNPPVVYQNKDNAYIGTITQLGANGWNPADISRRYQGKVFRFDNDTFFFGTSYTRGLTTTNTRYDCFCAGGGQYNGTCYATPTATSGITTAITNPLKRYNFYYKLTCNTLHAGLWQFLAYQFIPLNFYNPPPRTLAPQLPLYESVENLITFPNKTGGPNQWPTPGITPNDISNLTINETLYNWLDNPTNIFCGDIVNSFPYCGFSDYYLSLLRVFYDKGSCGNAYDPPDTSVPPVTISGNDYYFSNSCTDPLTLTKGICVPNYKYLLDPTANGVAILVAAGNPSVVNNNTVIMKSINDQITTDIGFDSNTVAITVGIVLPNIGNATFEIGISNEHETRISQGTIIPFGLGSNITSYRSGQLLRIDYSTDLLNTARVFLDGVQIGSITGYTQGLNQKLFFKYISASPVSSYTFSEIRYGDEGGSLIKPFVCLTPPTITDPATGSTNGFEKIRIGKLTSPYYQDVVKDVITWQNFENYIFSYPQNTVPSNQVSYQPAPAPPQNVINALNGGKSSDGGTPKSSSNNLFLIIGIIIAILIIGIIIFFIVRSAKKKELNKTVETSPYQYKLV
jgi:hypothetical protein